MQQRVVGVRAVDASVLGLHRRFCKQEIPGETSTPLGAECRALLDAGADVIVPAGGIPMMLFGGASGANIDGAPIVNGMSVIAKAAEMAVKLRRDCGIGVSRRSNFARAPERALKEFLES